MSIFSRHRARSRSAFSGWHMTMILVAFFGTVIMVNLIMAFAAIGTFGGTVVDNSYVASQKYNDWLRSARAQAAQSWQAEARLDGERHVVVSLVRGKDELLAATGAAQHPLGREPDIILAFRPSGDGQLRSLNPLPAGRWQVRLDLTNGGESARLLKLLS